MRTVFRSLGALPASILVVILGGGLAYAGVTPAQKCEASQLKAVGKDAVCQANQLAKDVLGGTTDLTKCTTTFDAAFMNAEAKGGCLTILDAAQTESRVSGAIKGIRAPLEGSCAPKIACGLDDCGLVADGCGGVLDCGVCENPCSSDADCIQHAGVRTRRTLPVLRTEAN
jgi:hypothetical protein